MFSIAAWLLGPTFLLVGLAALIVRGLRRRAEPLRSALGGWFPFTSSTLCFKRDGVVFSLTNDGGDAGGRAVLSACGGRPGRLMIGRAGAEKYCAFGFPPEPVTAFEDAGLKLITGCDEPGLRERVGRLTQSSAILWDRLFPHQHGAFTWGPETHLGRGRVLVLKLLGLPPGTRSAHSGACAGRRAAEGRARARARSEVT